MRQGSKVVSKYLLHHSPGGGVSGSGVLLQDGGQPLPAFGRDAVVRLELTTVQLDLDDLDQASVPELEGRGGFPTPLDKLTRDPLVGATDVLGNPLGWDSGSVLELRIGHTLIPLQPGQGIQDANLGGQQGGSGGLDDLLGDGLRLRGLRHSLLLVRD